MHIRRNNNVKFIALIILFSTSQLFTQNKADDILGIWVTTNKDAHIEISKRDGKYYGIIIWNMTNDALDNKNPDQQKRTRKITGIEILKSFVYDGDDQWDDGEIYDPESGKTYSCKIWMDDKNTLNVKGYIGFSFIGRSEVWTRKKS